MELELDPSSLGESFNKVGDYHSELDMEKLRAVGPLDQVEAPVAKLWLADDVSESKPGIEKNFSYNIRAAQDILSVVCEGTFLLKPCISHDHRV